MRWLVLCLLIIISCGQNDSDSLHSDYNYIDTCECNEISMENFSTYIEVDPGNDVVAGTNKVTATNYAVTDSDTYVYDDKGIDGITDFVHSLEINVSSEDINIFHTICSDIDDISGQTSYISLSGGFHAPDYMGLVIKSNIGGSKTSSVLHLSFDTSYYLIYKRVSSTVWLYVYSDANYTNLIGSTSLLGVGTALRYYMPIISDNVGLPVNAGSFYIQNVDLSASMPVLPGSNIAYNISRMRRI